MWRQGHCLHRRHISSSSTKVATARCICKNIQTTFTSKHRQQHRHGQLPPKYENRQQVWKSLSKQYFSTTTPSSSPSSSSSSSSSKDDRQGVGLTNADFDDDDFQQQQQQQHQLQNDKVGLIYHPHKYKLLESQQWLAEHIRCCITGKFLHILQDNATTDIEEDHDDNNNNNNNQNNGTSIDSNVIGNGKNVAIQRGNNNIITNGNNNNLNSSTDMSLYFLGTSAGMPTRSRSTTSTLLRLGGYAYLFDVGEGTQRQLMFAMGKLSEIERIFITHLHGDHVMGLPALLLGMQNAFKDSKTKTNENRKKERMRNKNNQQHRRTSRSEDQSSSSGSSKDFTVKIYGPPGLYNYVVSSLCYTCSQIHFINIEVYELVGGRVRRQHFSHHRGQDNDDNNNNSNNNSRTKNPFDGSYPEFNHPRITRHKIRCDEKDRIWYIEDLEPVTEQSILGGRSDRRSIRRATQIQAAEVDHMNGVATFGYTVTEEEPPNNIDIEKAKALGILPGKGGKKLSLLQRGFPVEPDNQEQDMVDTNKSSSTTTTNTLIRPEQVWSLPKKKKARKVAIVGDNRGWTTQMTQIAQNTDVLVHEATLSEEDFSVRTVFHIGFFFSPFVGFYYIFKLFFPQTKNYET